MVDLQKQIQAAKVKAVRELEQNGTDDYLPVNRWGIDLSVIDRANLAVRTKAKYRRELRALLNTGIDPFDFNALQEYAAGLKSSRRAFLKSALRLMSIEYEQSVKAGATPENLPAVQAVVMRLEAMRATVKVQTHKGTKVHTWLSPLQVQEITALCGNDLEGKRDWIILGLLLGAGLRREELVELTFDALKQQPTKSGKMRDVLQLTGKGSKDRVIPISSLLADRLREWHDIVGGGLVARSLGMKKELGTSLSAVAAFQIVRKYGVLIGIPELAPHDLRRTYAHLGYNAGIPITQIKELLGHASLTTTQKYLDLTIDLENTAGDFIPLSGD
jgi:integrase